VTAFDFASPAGPAVLLPLGVLAGVAATLAMDVATARLPERLARAIRHETPTYG
jgi:hypothetical protein